MTLSKQPDGRVMEENWQAMAADRWLSEQLFECSPGIRRKMDGGSQIEVYYSQPSVISLPI